jgi:hypothetical protein
MVEMQEQDLKVQDHQSMMVFPKLQRLNHSLHHDWSCRRPPCGGKIPRNDKSGYKLASHLN